MNYYLLFTIAVLKTVLANECGVTPIEVWGGSSSNRTEWLPSPVNLVVIQHTVTPECMTDEECFGSLRAIRANQQSTGYTDIGISSDSEFEAPSAVVSVAPKKKSKASSSKRKAGPGKQHDLSPPLELTRTSSHKSAQRKRKYSSPHEFITTRFLIGGNGKVYEGSGWRVGAHTAGYNNISIAISFMGDFRYKLPTPRALTAAQEFIVCGMHKKRLGFSYKLVGHQQLIATLSPGAELQRVIETWPHWVSDVRDL